MIRLMLLSKHAGNLFSIFRSIYQNIRKINWLFSEIQKSVVKVANFTKGQNTISCLNNLSHLLL